MFQNIDSSHPYYIEIITAAKSGVFAGYDNGDGTYSFKPNNTTTKAEVVHIINGRYNVDLDNLDYSKYHTPIIASDVNKNFWAYDAIFVALNGLLK